MKGLCLASLIALVPLGAWAQSSSSPMIEWGVTAGHSSSGSNTCTLFGDLGNHQDVALVADAAQPPLTFTLVFDADISAPQSQAFVSQLSINSDGAQSITIQGTTRFGQFQAILDSTIFKPFLHIFTADTSMTMTLDTNPVTVVNLSGTTGASEAMWSCEQAQDIDQPASVASSVPVPAPVASSVAVPAPVALAPDYVATGEVSAVAATAVPTFAPDYSKMPAYQTDDSPQETSYWQHANADWTDITDKQKAICEAIPPGGAQPISYSELEDCVEKFDAEDQNGPASGVSPQQDQTPTNADAETITNSNVELQFIQIVTKAATNYGQAPNQMAGGGLRASRANAICSLFGQSLSVTDWSGIVENLDSSNQGWGVLGIKLSNGITVTTTNNGLSDGDFHTLIDPNSTLFKIVSALAVGDTVKFSGSFFHDDANCFTEESLAQDGSMTSPDFTFRFDSVQNTINNPS